jgi:O-acetylserine/cysteine efflux transporter
MLVPFFGLASAALLLSEQITAVDVLGGALVVGGILLGLTRQTPAVQAPTFASAASTVRASAESPACQGS